MDKKNREAAKKKKFFKSFFLRKFYVFFDFFNVSMASSFVTWFL